MYPANFPGLGEALIFFCFFSSIKGRKEDPEGKKKTPILGIDHSFPAGNVWGRMQYAPTRAHPIYFFEENICPIPHPIFRF